LVAGANPEDVRRAIDAFVEFKVENGANAAFGTVDKSSGVNRRGETIKVFADNNIWHAHLASKGDPLIVDRRKADSGNRPDDRGIPE
jgi:hypothetical protein